MVAPPCKCRSKNLHDEGHGRSGLPSALLPTFPESCDVTSHVTVHEPRDNEPLINTKGTNGRNEAVTRPVCFQARSHGFPEQMIELQSTWHLLIISVHQRSLAVHLFCSVNAYPRTALGSVSIPSQIVCHPRSLSDCLPGKPPRLATARKNSWTIWTWLLGQALTAGFLERQSRRWRTLSVSQTQ